MTLQKIRTALVSVSDKSNLSNVLKLFRKYNIQILSSGGTYEYIKKLGYNSIEVSDYTDFMHPVNMRPTLALCFEELIMR